MTSQTWQLFDVNEMDYTMTWLRRGKLLAEWGTLIGAVIYSAFMITWWAVKGLDGQTAVIFVFTEALAFSVICYEHWELTQMNRYGIFEDGISPPRKPKTFRKSNGRVIVPYTSLTWIEYKKVGSGLFPKSHYGAILHLNDGEEFEFDASEIYAQTRWKEEEVAKAQVILEELARQLNRWRCGGSEGVFTFRYSGAKG